MRRQELYQGTLFPLFTNSMMKGGTHCNVARTHALTAPARSAPYTRIQAEISISATQRSGMPFSKRTTQSWHAPPGRSWHALKAMPSQNLSVRGSRVR
jgi:hypothetical protein